MIDVLVKRGRTADDLQLKAWRFIEKVFKRLGPDGQSSEDSPGENESHVFKVRIMIWRRDISKILKIIDDKHKEDTELYEPRGTKPIKRVQGLEKTRRSALKQLPKSFYNEEWLEEETSRAFTLEIDPRDTFEWFDVERIDLSLD